MIKIITFPVIGLMLTIVVGTKAGVGDGDGYTTIPIPVDVVGSVYNGPWNINRPVSEEELNCMALNIYFEARGESLKGQRAVAEVVMNRVMHHRYPDTICGVVKAGVYPRWDTSKRMPIKNRCAFEWYCDRKSDEVLDADSFEVAKKVAKNVVTNPQYEPMLPAALFYHADTILPYWAKSMDSKKVIGNHIFY